MTDKPTAPALQPITDLAKLPAKYHVLMRVVKPGQSFNGRSGTEYRVGRGGLVTPNPTDKKDLAFFVEASSADVFPGPAPDFSNHQPQSNESLSADNKGLASALDSLRGDLARREEKIRELEERCALLERDLKAAQVANESLKGSARGGK